LKKQHFIGFTIVVLTFSLMFTLVNKHDVYEVEALSPMPTNINVTDLNDEQVNAYYDGVASLQGDIFLGALNNIIKDHNEYNYDSDAHRTIYKIIDRNWELSPLTPEQLTAFNYTTDNPFIHKLYADYNDSEETADRFKNDGASRVSFDKEHIWAQSLGNFGRDGGAGSDFHALWPADVKGNQQAHSNYNYATPTSSITSVNNDYGTYVGRNGYITGSTQKVFEPLDEYKGDIARAMFYMPARYFTYVDVLHPKLTLVNGSPASIVASASQPGLAGDLATLLAWHELDPVDEYEIHRNNLLYNNYQGNRNPFIDHPEWAEIAYDPEYTGDGASILPGSSSVGDGVDPDPDPDPDPVITFDSLAVSLKIPTQKFYLFDEVKASDYQVSAIYSDDTSELVTSFSLSIVGQTDLRLNKLGSHTLVFSLTLEEVTRSAQLTIDVQISMVQIIIGVSALIVFGGVFFLIPPIRRSIFKTAKRQVNKSIKRKR